MKEVIRSAGFEINPVLGQIKTGKNIIALGPVNMKVLVVLLESPGNAIGRSEFYQKVWGDQIVSDDALTRCISDIRSELGRFQNEEKPETKLIETLPKRGYRWLPPVERISEVDLESKKSVLLQYLGFSVLSVLIITLTTIGLLNYFSTQVSNFVRIAVMPIESPSAEFEYFAVELGDSIRGRILASPNLRFVSQRALVVQPLPSYTTYARNLNVKWIIEGEIRKKNNNLRISLNLVDAHTSLVEHNQTIEGIGANIDTNKFSSEFLSQASALFLKND